MRPSSRAVGDHYNGDLGITQDIEFMSFLEEPIFPLGVGDLPVGRVLNLLDLNLPPTHEWTVKGEPK